MPFYTLVSEHSRPAKTGDTYDDVGVTGEDGELRKGVTWPTPRFTDNTDGTVTDNLTGLIWLKNADCAEMIRPWALALSYSNALYDGCSDCFNNHGDCGLSDGSSAGDWRLPNVRELYSLIDVSQADPALPSGHPFTNVKLYYYWSSTDSAPDLYKVNRWFVTLDDGLAAYTKHSDKYRVWPVRGGQ